MENKKSFLPTILVIFILLLITLAGYIVYNLYLQNKNLEESLNRLEEKVDSISVISNSNTNAELNSSTSNDNLDLDVIFSNDEIKTAIQNYLDLIGAAAGSPENLLVKLGLTSFNQYTDRTDDNYIKTNIKYSDYKNKMLNYMTEQWFENNFTNYHKNVNGSLYFFDGGATGMNFDVESVSLKGDYSDSSYIANVYNIHMDDSKELEHIEFHIENYNGKCVISYCD